MLPVGKTMQLKIWEKNWTKAVHYIHRTSIMILKWGSERKHTFPIYFKVFTFTSLVVNFNSVQNITLLYHKVMHGSHPIRINIGNHSKISFFIPLLACSA